MDEEDRVNTYKNDFMPSKARHIDFEILNTSLHVFYKLPHNSLNASEFISLLEDALN